MDDKIKINTLHMMDVLDKAYSMVTKESPQKLMTLTSNKFKQRYSKSQGRNPVLKDRNSTASQQQEQLHDIHS